MKGTPAPLVAAMQGDCDLAVLIKLTRTDGIILSVTDHDEDISYDGITYKASLGMSASAIQTTAALNVDNLEAKGFLSMLGISEASIAAGRWDYCDVRIYRVNWADLSMGDEKLLRGWIGNVSLGRNEVTNEVRSLSQKLQNNIGEIVSETCKADLGDRRCKVDLLPFTVTGTVEGVSNNRVISDSSRTELGPLGGVAISGISQSPTVSDPTIITATAHGLTTGMQVTLTGIIGASVFGTTLQSMTTLNGRVYEATVIDGDTFSIPVISTSDIYGTYEMGGVATPVGSGYFANGKITFTSGKNEGLSMEIRSYVTGEIVLASYMPYTIEIDDTYTAIAGCLKRFVEDCGAKYTNQVNFRGFPTLPGQDAVLRGPV